MAYQFFHIETYSRKARPVKSGGYTLGHHMNSTAQVFGEALRERLHSGHVEEPRKPVPVGDPFIHLAELRSLHDHRIAEISETVTLPNGASYQRKLREDADTLYTEIHSHPMSTAEYWGARTEKHPIVAAWAKLAMNDFLARMTEGVKASAVIHLDEGYVHMHILAVNFGDPKLDANKLHLGKRKAAEVRANHDDRLPVLPKPELLALPLKPKKPKPSRTKATQAKRDKQYAEALAEWEKAVAEAKAQNEVTLSQWKTDNTTQRQRARAKAGEPKAKVAYNSAMKQLQDDYYEAVGKPCGLLRDGPRLKRRSTKEHAEDIRRAAALAHNIIEITETEASIAQLKTDREEAEKAVAQPLADLAAKEIELDAKAKEQEAEKAKLDDQTRSLDAREADIARKEADQKAKAAELYAQNLQKLKAAEQTAWKAIEQKAAELVDREAKVAAQEVSLQAQTEANEAEKAHLDDLRKELTAKQREVSVAQREINEITEGMSVLMDALEGDQIDMEANPQALKGLHWAFRRLFGTREDMQTPMQKLLGRFLGLLRRKQRDAGRPQNDTHSFDI